MKQAEFIKMMYQDIETHKNKAQLSIIVQAMNAALDMHPSIDINPEGKTPENCYKKMYEYAKNNSHDKVYCFNPDKSLEFISKYLGVGTVNLTAAAKPVAKINLEDFL